MLTERGLFVGMWYPGIQRNPHPQPQILKSNPIANSNPDDNVSPMATCRKYE